LSKSGGQVTLSLDFELDENGFITGAALDEINEQVPGEGARPGFAFYEVFVERPNSQVTHFKFTGTTTRPSHEQGWPSHDPNTGVVPYPVTTSAVVNTPQGVGFREYFYIAYEPAVGSDEWKPIPSHSYEFTIEWFAGEPGNGGSLVKKETIEILVVEN